MSGSGAGLRARPDRRLGPLLSACTSPTPISFPLMFHSTEPKPPHLAVSLSPLLPPAAPSLGDISVARERRERWFLVAVRSRNDQERSLLAYEIVQRCETEHTRFQASTKEHDRRDPLRVGRGRGVRR